MCVKWVSLYVNEWDTFHQHFLSSVRLSTGATGYIFTRLRFEVVSVVSKCDYRFKKPSVSFSHWRLQLFNKFKARTWLTVQGVWKVLHSVNLMLDKILLNLISADQAQLGLLSVRMTFPPCERWCVVFSVVCTSLLRGGSRNRAVWNYRTHWGDIC